MDRYIDISNYEEYLLSAVDGELSKAEMAELEVFLQQHPHIREELALLEAAKLTPDQDLLFDGKASLYRREDTPSLTAYETQLLDYIDNELNAPDKQALETLMHQHPSFAEEVALLQRTKLQPDLLTGFGDKSVLYRNNRTKIRPIWWWSAAAAVVAGVAVMLLPVSRVSREEPGTSQLAKNQPVIKQPAPVATPVTPAPVPEVVSKPAKEEQQLAAGKLNKLNQTKYTNTSTKPEPVAAQQAVTDNSSNTGIARLAQPVTTSGEVVQQLQDKINEQQEQVAAAITNPVPKAPVMANASQTTKAADVVSAAAPGELVVSVTMNGDSKLLNGVANVARFFSKRKNK